MIKPSTFSIVAFDSKASSWGIAVASKFPAAGAVVPWARADAGAVATQSYANTSYGPLGLEMMASGRTAQETLDTLIAEDDGRDLRQAGLVDLKGGVATYTGKDCFDWAGGRSGDGYCLQGNILVGELVLQRMAEAYEGTPGELPERLLAALFAGDRAGGDRRGRQSAALLVVKPEGGYGGYNDRWIDYRVDDHADPVPRLLELLELHHLYFDKSPSEEELAIEGEICRNLQSLMIKQDYALDQASGIYDPATQKALRQFLGNENFEERANFDTGRIDAPVYEFLVRKFG
ncbi:MAG: DUF1028 domain-containing protein [Anaerolineales bacterium]|nr:MAG: DUF1028 domain-containing protein [Anaerolineales bacterium]